MGYANLLQKPWNTRGAFLDGRRYSHGAIAARLGRKGDAATQAWLSVFHRQDMSAEDEIGEECFPSARHVCDEIGEVPWMRRLASI